MKNYLNTRNDNSEHLIVSMRGVKDKVNTFALKRFIKKIASRVSDRVTKNVIPHKIRHTTATQTLKSGMPIEKISKLLGYSQISTTMIYADVDAEDLQSAYSKYVV